MYVYLCNHCQHTKEDKEYFISLGIFHMLFLVGKEVFDSDLVLLFFFLPPLALSPVFRYIHHLVEKAESWK